MTRVPLIVATAAFGALVGGCATTVETGPGYYHYDTRTAGDPPAIVHEAPAVVYRAPDTTIVQSPTTTLVQPPVVYQNPPVVYSEPGVVYQPAVIYRDPAAIDSDPAFMYRNGVNSPYSHDHGQ